MPKVNCYIDEDEEITSVIDKIKNVQSKDIELVFPKKSPLIRSIVNLKILKKQSEALKKNITITTKDEIGQALAKKAKLKVKSDIPKPLEKTKTTPKEKEKTTDVNDRIDKSSSSKAEEVDAPAKDLDQDLEKLKQIPTPEVNKPDYKKINQETKAKKVEELKQKFQKKQEQRLVLLPSFTSKLVVGFFAACFIIAVVAILFLLPQATILLTPKTEPFTHNLEITLSKDIDQPNFEERIMPFEIATAEKESAEETFKATGEREIGKKSKGQVIIYNKYSSEAQPLVASTRFVSSDGRLYRLVQDIDVPGAKIKEGKKVPGRISAVIEADQSGQEFDLESSQFTIPGLPSDKQDDIFAESLEEISGGESKKIQVITAEDLKNAKESLTKKITEQAAEELKNQVTEDEIILESAIKNETIDSQTNGEEEKETKDFKMSVAAKSTMPIVKKEDLEKIVFEDAQGFLPENKQMFNANLEEGIEYEKITETPEEISLKIAINKKIFTELDKEEIKRNITGKDAEETESYLMTNPYIYKAEIMLWPFWVKKVPRIKSKIKIMEKSLDQAENE